MTFPSASAVLVFTANYLHQQGFLVTRVYLLVGLSAGFHKNYRTDFHKTWMEDGSRPRMDPINFWSHLDK